MADEHRTGKPHDRLTRLTEVMTDALEADSDYTDTIKCIVFLNDGKRAGIQMHGYGDDTEAMADLLVHLQAMFRANGKTMDIAFLGDTGIDRVDG